MIFSSDYLISIAMNSAGGPRRCDFNDPRCHSFSILKAE